MSFDEFGYKKWSKQTIVNETDSPVIDLPFLLGGDTKGRGRQSYAYYFKIFWKPWEIKETIVLEWDFSWPT